MNSIEKLKDELRRELRENILPYWSRLIDTQHGGFYGWVDNDNHITKQAPKWGINIARILWTFSAAYRIMGDKEYLHAATVAKDFIVNHMIDNEYGGLYWTVDYKGNPLESKKQIYALGFAIYGLSEYYRATKDSQALQHAIKLFEAIESHAHDTEEGGYLEAFNRDWSPIEDMRLSDKDANAPKSMNTHLHILEPYTNLLRVWNDERLRDSLKSLVEIFMEKIIDKRTNHCNLFFDMQWRNQSSVISYGHDIEAFWLLYDAIETLDDSTLCDKYRPLLPLIATAALEGVQPDGSLIYDKNCATEVYDMERHWWAQAETIVGCYYLCKDYGDEDAMRIALANWEYIKHNLIDPTGEWYWSRLGDGTINRSEVKAGAWKCPYHNGRLCLILNEK